MNEGAMKTSYPSMPAMVVSFDGSAANAQPDRTVMQARAFDTLVHKGQRWRVRGVQIYRSSLVLDDRAKCWCESVDDAIRDASQ